MNSKKQPPKPARLTFICSHCGSSNVSRDASMAWNSRKQEWEQIGLNDSAYCNDCDGECTLQEVILEGE